MGEICISPTMFFILAGGWGIGLSISAIISFGLGIRWAMRVRDNDPNATGLTQEKHPSTPQRRMRRA